MTYSKHYPKDILLNHNHQTWTPPAYSQQILAWYHQYLEVSGLFLIGEHSLLVDKPVNQNQYVPLKELTCHHNVFRTKKECFNPIKWWHPRHNSLFCELHAPTQNYKNTIAKFWFSDLYEITQGHLLQQYPQLKHNLPLFTSILYQRIT